MTVTCLRKVEDSRSATLLKQVSITDIFQWIFCDCSNSYFSEHLRKLVLCLFYLQFYYFTNFSCVFFLDEVVSYQRENTSLKSTHINVFPVLLILALNRHLPTGIYMQLKQQKLYFLVF